MTYSQVENMEQTFVEPMRELYVSSDVSAVSKRWNEQREAILRDAVEQLVPQLQAEAIAQLLVDAREVALQQCRDTLWQYASAAPLQVCQALWSNLLTVDTSPAFNAVYMFDNTPYTQHETGQ